MAGRVGFLTSLGFGGSFGLGTVATSGDVPPNPIFGNGATGLVACFAGREGPGKPEKGSLVAIFGDSKSTTMGAGGATGFGSGGGGWRLALNCLRSRSRTAFDKSFSTLALARSSISISRRLTRSHSSSSKSALNFSTAAGMRASIDAAAAAGVPFPSGRAALKAFAVATNLEADSQQAGVLKNPGLHLPPR